MLASRKLSTFDLRDARDDIDTVRMLLASAITPCKITFDFFSETRNMKGCEREEMQSIHTSFLTIVREKFFL